jgi:exodeoxyribonuclease VII large subunit
VLERGYTITRDEHGRVVRHAADAVAGALIVTELADGKLASRVESSAGSPDGARRGVRE